MKNLMPFIFPKILNRILCCSLSLILFSSCNDQQTTGKTSGALTEQSTTPQETAVNASKDLPTHINSIFQDKNNHYWFASNAQGVYRYDGKTLIRFTEKDGLASDQVHTVQEDAWGNIWFNTAGGVSRFNAEEIATGKTITSFTAKDSLQLNINSLKERNSGPNDLWFFAGSGGYRYDRHSFIYVLLPKSDTDRESSGPKIPVDPFSDPLNPYSVYCSMKDRKGNIWFGTQTMGVCRFDPTNKTFTWLSEKGLAGPAVRGLFEDSQGNMWFGNNGYGLFKYDTKGILTNITEENGLGNEAFFKSKELDAKSVPGTLARVWTINEDNNGDIWIGTADAGAWRYDGENLINYTMKDGLTSNAINVIYKDKQGELWFGTDGGGVCNYNGVSFTAFTIK